MKRIKNIKEVRNLILGAIGVLHVRGWCQLKYEDRDHRVCILRSLRLAEMEQGYDLSVFNEPYYEAKTALMQHIGCDDLVYWNDNPGRCAEDVIEEMSSTASWLTDQIESPVNQELAAE